MVKKGERKRSMMLKEIIDRSMGAQYTTVEGNATQICIKQIKEA